MLKFCLLALTLIALTPKHLEAGFSNNGTMRSNKIMLHVRGNLDNNGSLIGRESADISCGSFTGSGLLEAPVIHLSTDLFAYTGIIRCSQECIITATRPFDENMFTRQGEGTFTFIITPSPEPISLSVEDLSSETLEFFVN